MKEQTQTRPSHESHQLTRTHEMWCQNPTPQGQKTPKAPPTILPPSSREHRPSCLKVKKKGIGWQNDEPEDSKSQSAPHMCMTQLPTFILSLTQVHKVYITYITTITFNNFPVGLDWSDPDVTPDSLLYTRLRWVFQVSWPLHHVLSFFYLRPCPQIIFPPFR